MKTRRLTKKYKNKRNKKSIKRKNKSRKRILKGGVPTRGVLISRTSRGTSRGSTAPRPSSRGSIAPRGSSIGSTSPRGTSRGSTGISKLPIQIPSKCCDTKSISEGQKLIESIRNFPHTFDQFYNILLMQSETESGKNIPDITEAYLKKITIESKGEYLNITGLQLISYLIYKYNRGSDTDKEKIKIIISLLDQYAAAPGVRKSDLRVIRTQLDKDNFECYKELYEKISSQLFQCRNGNCYPVSTSAISLYCKPPFKPTLQTTHEIDE